MGTDCSGLDTPIAALEEILLGRNRQIHHVFSSECDPMTLKILLHNFTPDYHYTDVARRKHPPVEQLPNLDIYVAGFPCQTFRRAGCQPVLRIHAVLSGFTLLDSFRLRCLEQWFWRM